MPISRLLHYLYIYPFIIWPAIAAQQALRRRIFGEHFWDTRSGQP